MQHILAVPSPAGMDGSSALAPAELLPGLGQAWNKTAAPRGLPPVFPDWLKGLDRLVWSLQCPFQGAGCGAVLSLSSSLVIVPSQPVPGRFQVYLCEPPKARTPFVFCAAQISSPFWFHSCCQVEKHFPGISCRSPWPSHSGVCSWAFSFCRNIWCIWIRRPENQWVVTEASGTHEWV